MTPDQPGFLLAVLHSKLLGAYQYCQPRLFKPKTMMPDHLIKHDIPFYLGNTVREYKGELGPIWAKVEQEAANDL